MATFADLDAADVGALADVRDIARVAARKGGTSDLQLLDCLGSMATLRDIADALHMHHSSMAYRLEHLSGTLGYDVRTQTGRYRALTALTLWQLHVAPH